MNKDIAKLIWLILRLLGIIVFIGLAVYGLLHFGFKMF